MRDWCEAHYNRLRRSGDTGSGYIPRVVRGEVIGYAGAHCRVRRERGKAARYPCQYCRGTARGWAYGHSDLAEIRDDRGYPYSTDPTHYIPLCVPCHKRLDFWRLPLIRKAEKGDVA